MSGAMCLDVNVKEEPGVDTQTDYTMGVRRNTNDSFRSA